MVQLPWEEASTYGSLASLVTKFLLRPQVLALVESPVQKAGLFLLVPQLFSCQIKWEGGGIAGGQLAYPQSIHKGVGRSCEFLLHLGGRRGKTQKVVSPEAG